MPLLLPALLIASALPTAPAGLHFDVHPRAQRHTFYQGESIELVLSFRADTPETWQLDAATYDRSGRLDLERFAVTPERAIDPVAEWFAEGLGGLGGLRSMPVLGAETEQVVVDLAEHLWFTEPGAYELTVVTERVTDTTGAIVPLAATVSLVIEAAPRDWAAARVEDALQTLADPAGDHRAAARTLRFLGAPEAVEPLVQQLSRAPQSSRFELALGWVGSPHRAALLDDMHAELTDPAVSIDSHWLHTAAVVEAGATGIDRSAAQQLLLTRLADAVPRKEPEARAVALHTLQELGWRASDAAPVSDPPDAAALRAALLDLPPDQQAQLLGYRWRRLAHPDLVEPLTWLAREGAHESVRFEALRRLEELDPAAARPLLLASVEDGGATLGLRAIEVLRRLPDEALPALDATLLAGLERPGATPWHLLARFASDDVGPALDTWCGHPELASDPLGACLAWSLKHGDEERAHGLLERARPTTLVWALRSAAELYGSGHPLLEQAAARLLQGEDEALAAQAAHHLQRWGSADAEALLWQRLERFSRDHAGDRGALDARHLGLHPLSDALQLEDALWRALGHGRGWHFDQTGRRRLDGLLLSAQARDQARFLEPHPEPDGAWRLAVHFRDDGQLDADLLQYRLDSRAALLERLARLPEGTQLRWVHQWPNSSTEPDAARLRAEVAEALAARRGTLTD